MWDYLEDLELDRTILKIDVKEAGNEVGWTNLAEAWSSDENLWGDLWVLRKAASLLNIERLSVSQEGLFLVSVGSFSRGFLDKKIQFLTVSV